MKTLFTLFILLFSTVLNAQRFDFGKVSEEEILEQEHPTDHEAPAAVLYKKSRIYFEYDNQWQYVQEVEARVKIYKKEGFDEATVEVPLYKPGAGSNQIFSNLRAFTYNLDGKKVVKERVRNDAQFQEIQDDNWVSEKFTFPNVKEGSVIEYSYKVTSPYLSSLPWFYFQEDIPVNFAEYKLETPEYLGYKSYNKGFFPLKIEESREQDLFTFRYVPKLTDGNTAVGSHKTQEGTLNYTLLKTIYTAENVPKITREEYLNNFYNYLTAMKHELEWTKFPNTELKTFAKSWDDVVKNIFKSDHFGKELEEKNYFENEITQLITEAKTNKEKAATIFEFLKSKMTWNGIYGKYTRDGVKKAYASRTGNVAEINLMLTAMFRNAGLYASPVLVSTKRHGIPLFPTVDGYNYLISSVEMDGQTFLFDATNPYSTPNILPERTLNWFGRKVRKDEESEAINLMATNASRRVTNLEVKLNEGGTLEGKLRNTYTDHLALEIRDSYASLSDEKYIENLENHYSSLTVSNFGFQNKKDPYKPLVESYDFENANAFDQMGDKIFFQPSFFLISTKNPFTAETRSYPIDFKYPTQETYMINIFVPEGYQVESLPQSEIFELPGGLGDFKYMISNTDNNIQLRINTSINSTLVPADFYEPLKAFYEAKVTKLSEKITLSKI
ncbi:MAG: DUF3857 domain-containing protein [Flavobacteriaceae bacterium]|nr:DUF3857 domain-containing protein [Flavobacteriaceae bacterium]